MRPVTRMVAAAGLLLAQVRGAHGADAEHSADLAFITRRSVEAAPEIAALASRVQEAESGRQAVQRARLPRITAYVAATRGNDPVYAFGSRLRQGRFGSDDFLTDRLNFPDDITNWQSGVEATMPLFTGLELTSNARQMDLQRQRALASQADALQARRLETADTYLRFIIADHVASELTERIQSARNELNDAKRLRDRGVILGSDYEAAESIYAGLIVWETQVTSERDAARAHLLVLSGIAVESPDGPIRVVIDEAPDQETLSNGSGETRPDLKASNADVEMASNASAQDRRFYLPRVSAFGRVETNTRDFSSNPGRRMVGATAQVAFGDLAAAARSKASADANAAARQGHEALAQRARIEIADAYAAYTAGVQTLPDLEDAASRAQRSLELVRPLYRSGRQSIIEVLRAEDAAAKAEAARFEGVIGIHRRYLTLMAAAGLLDEEAIDRISTALGARP